MKIQKSIQDLNNLTILILSHQRQHCLNQVLPYWEKYAIKTLVLDNSPEPLKNLSNYKYCTYVHSQNDFNKRSIEASKLINTKYVMAAADDELYLPATLKKMLDFLESNQDYSSVGGAVLAVWKYGPIIAANWAYKKTFRYHNKESNANARISYHTGDGINPTTSFFTCNMTRSANLINCLKLYGEAPILATDAISVLSICAAGKSYYLNDLYWIRNWNEFPKSHKGWDRSIYLHEWWDTNKESEEWKRFYLTLKNFYFINYNRNDFDVTWNLILNASRILQPSINKEKFKKTHGEYQYKILSYIVYPIKKLMKKNFLDTSDQVLNNMQEQGIEYDEIETKEAIGIVSKLKPYKNW